MAARTGLRTLRIHLCPLAELAAGTELAFELLDARRRIGERGRAVPAALPKGKGMRVELILAAPDVLLLDARLPRLSGERMRASLASIAEPALLGDIEHAFVAAGKPDADGRAVLAVVDRALFKRAIDLFSRLGMEVGGATAEPLTLPARRGIWRLRMTENYGCLRIGERLGIACAPSKDSQPPVELRLALSRHAPLRPDTIEVEGKCDAAKWSEALGLNVKRVAPDDAYAAPLTLNLLQFEFAPRVVDWRVWRLPVALAASLALISITDLNVDAWRASREARETRAQMNATFRETFPETPVVQDPLIQTRRAVADLRGGAGTSDPADFIPLATRFAQAAQLDADAIRTLEYRDRALYVRFDSRGSEPAKREALVERLVKAGLVARMSESTLIVRNAEKL
jgi:type II secretion system protein L